jgi:hypothetical protein
LKENNMPEVSRFYGIIIRMFMEPAVQHNVAHFHAYYQEYSAVFSIDNIEKLNGELPRKEQRLVEAWAELHKDELLV